MIARSRRDGWRYGFAVACVAALLALKLLCIDRLIGPVVPPYVLFLVPVILSAWAGGAGPGVLALALATLASAYAYEPRHTPAVRDASEALLLTVFAGEGLLICWLMGRLHRARAAPRPPAAPRIASWRWSATSSAGR